MAIQVIRTSSPGATVPWVVVCDEDGRERTVYFGALKPLQDAYPDRSSWKGLTVYKSFAQSEQVQPFWRSSDIPEDSSLSLFAAASDVHLCFDVGTVEEIKRSPFDLSEDHEHAWNVVFRVTTSAGSCPRR